MPNKIRLGLIGASVSGTWSARAHLPALRASSDVELTAVCTTRADSAEAARRAWDARLAFVVDDLESVNPWTPRGIEVRGLAELHDEGGESFGSGWDRAWIRILPQRIVSWGIIGSAFTPAGRSARSVG